MVILESVLLAANIAERFFPGIEPIPAPDPRVQMQLIPNEPQHGHRQIYGVKYEDGYLEDLMEEPMITEKTLRLAEDLIPLLVSGQKLVTIRKGKRMFGSTVNIEGHLAAVDLVEHSTIAACPLKVLKDDGFTSRKDAVTKMKRFYPDITAKTDITIVRFHLVK